MCYWISVGGTSTLMDIRVLKYFMEVVKKGNITRAAEALHITQPTLSRQLMDLEEEVGAQLFLRGKRKIMLTEAGFAYQRHVKEVLRILDKANQEASGKDNEVGGLIAIGCVETAASSYLADQLECFHKQYPSVQFELYNGFGDDIKSRIDSGELDLGILLEPVEAAKYDCIPLPIAEPWGILVADDHPFAELESVSVQALIQEPLILTGRNIVMDEIESWLNVDMDQLKILASHNLLTNSLPLIQKGLAITITVEGAYKVRPVEGFTFVPLDIHKASSHVITWKKNREQSRLSRLFIEQLKKTL